MSRRAVARVDVAALEHNAARLAAAAEAYPRPGRSRTILPTVPMEGQGR
jgi:hypothetical protein